MLRLHLLRAVGVKTSACHITTLYQNNQVLYTNKKITLAIFTR